MSVFYDDSLIVACLFKVSYQLLWVGARHHFIIWIIDKDSWDWAIFCALAEVYFEGVEWVGGEWLTQDRYCWRNKEFRYIHVPVSIKFTYWLKACERWIQNLESNVIVIFFLDIEEKTCDCSHGSSPKYKLFVSLLNEHLKYCRDIKLFFKTIGIDRALTFATATKIKAKQRGILKKMIN